MQKRNFVIATNGQIARHDVVWRPHFNRFPPKPISGEAAHRIGCRNSSRKQHRVNLPLRLLSFESIDSGSRKWRIVVVVGWWTKPSWSSFRLLNYKTAPRNAQTHKHTHKTKHMDLSGSPSSSSSPSSAKEPREHNRCGTILPRKQMCATAHH